MGEIVKISCGSCKEEWQCTTGYGLRHARLQDVVSAFPAAVERDIVKTAGDEPFPVFEFGYRISVCRNCRSIVSVPVLKLTEADAGFSGVCPVCRRKTRLVLNPKRTSCPSCGKRTLRAEETGHWD